MMGPNETIVRLSGMLSSDRLTLLRAEAWRLFDEQMAERQGAPVAAPRRKGRKMRTLPANVVPFPGRREGAL